MAVSPQHRPELDIAVENAPGETIVRCSGRITVNAADMLRASVRPLIAPGKNMALDLTNVAYLDSSGLGAVVGLFVSARRTDCKLRLTNLSEHVKEMFRLTRLGQMFIEGRDPDFPQVP